eukprot:2583387-Prymnesium_polylepis.1
MLCVPRCAVAGCFCTSRARLRTARAERVSSLVCALPRPSALCPIGDAGQCAARWPVRQRVVRCRPVLRRAASRCSVAQRRAPFFVPKRAWPRRARRALKAAVRLRASVR